MDDVGRREIVENAAAQLYRRGTMPATCERCRVQFYIATSSGVCRGTPARKRCDQCETWTREFECVRIEGNVIRKILGMNCEQDRGAT